MKSKLTLIRISILTILILVLIFSACGLFKDKYDVKVQNMTPKSATFIWDGTSYTIESLKIKTLSDIEEGEYKWEAEWEDEYGVGYTQSGEVTVDRHLYIKIYPTGVIIDEWVE